ncbi:hypothetical protein EDD37DRAFT_586883 [Exophiala viscosa]|uniref:uncharacterized protein n=1 Tax=Exophiala viscosa TaxID=2486360 RepID=UPI0021A24D90|nr:hypothetical protein EDD37DRAFT_586883 [Exophiala viscosa]
MVHQHSHTSRYNRLVAVAAAFGSLTYGYLASIIGSTIGQPGWYAFFNLPTTGQPGYATTTTNAIATANGLFSGGAALGCIWIMWAATSLGRKRNIQIGALVSLLGGALQGGAANLAMFQAGRFIAGLGVGVLVTICPMYLSEIAWWPTSHPRRSGGDRPGRPMIGTIQPPTSGDLPSAEAVDLDKPQDYLVLNRVRRTAPLARGVVIPDSPRWLLQKGRTEEAWETLKRLRETPDDPDNLVAKEELYQTKQQLALDTAKLKKLNITPLGAVFKIKSYRKRMIIGFLTQWGAEFGGPLVINNYSVILYTNLGQTGSMPLLLSALWLSTATLIYAPFGSWLHDRVNSRRWMFIIGLIGCLITTSAVAGCIAQYSGTGNKAGNAVGVFFVFFYLTFQGTCCDTTMYLYVSEIFPTEVRPIGMGFSLFGQFAATLILLQTAPIGFVTIGWKYYLVIICWCIVFIPAVYLYWPETARLSLEEISSKFGDDVAVHINDVSEEQRKELDDFLQSTDIIHLEAVNSAPAQEKMSATPEIV